jgi:F420-non-reducing hydrogenase small subunit
MPDKPKIAFYWCASCGGCEESVVDLAEGVLGVLDAVEFVLWPVAMDFKKHDVEALPDGAIAATLLNGAIRTSEHEEMARLLRRKSRVLIAYGSCAHQGGIPGLANEFSREDLLRYVYGDSPSTINPSSTRPALTHRENGFVATLPEFRHVVRSLDQVVPVDYYVPGCPPTPKLLSQAIEALLSSSLPERGSVLAPDVALCDECPRKDTKPTDVSYSEFKRPHLTALDPETCFLAQGIVCMGPATRGACEAPCIAGNMPCTGCFGPTSRVRDQGAKAMSSIASSIVPKDVESIERVLDGIPDPIGTFYRYGLARSILRGKASLRSGPEGVD